MARVDVVAGLPRTVRTDLTGVTSHMSEARTNTTEAHPQGAESVQAAAGAGKHRGRAATEEAQTASQHGRHRRPGQSAS